MRSCIPSRAPSLGVFRQDSVLSLALLDAPSHPLPQQVKEQELVPSYLGSLVVPPGWWCSGFHKVKGAETESRMDERQGDAETSIWKDGAWNLSSTFCCPTTLERRSRGTTNHRGGEARRRTEELKSRNLERQKERDRNYPIIFFIWPVMELLDGLHWVLTTSRANPHALKNIKRP